MVTYNIKKHVLDSLTFSTGEVVFIDGEVKAGNFDTLDEPVDLALFSHGEVRLKLEEKTGDARIQIFFGSIDHHTGEFYTQVNTAVISSNMTGRLLIGKEQDSFIGSKVAIRATVADGSFKVTSTGEFKK